MSGPMGMGIGLIGTHHHGHGENGRSSLVSLVTVPRGTESSQLPWDPLLDLTENPFGKAFHGYLTHSQAQDLLLKDGHYLVRKRDNDEEFVLTFR